MAIDRGLGSLKLLAADVAKLGGAGDSVDPDGDDLRDAEVLADSVHKVIYFKQTINFCFCFIFPSYYFVEPKAFTQGCAKMLDGFHSSRDFC